jgi:hypothetical protein
MYDVCERRPVQRSREGRCESQQRPGLHEVDRCPYPVLDAGGRERGGEIEESGWVGGSRVSRSRTCSIINCDRSWQSEHKRCTFVRDDVHVQNVRIVLSKLIEREEEVQGVQPAPLPPSLTPRNES